MERSCAHCGVSYVAKRKTSRYCSESCRAAAGRKRRAWVYPTREPNTEPTESAGATLHVLPGRRDDEPPEAGPGPQLGQPETYSVLAATLRDLAKVGAEDSAHGRTALVLAERIDARVDNGSAAAALVREWQRQLTAALDAGDTGTDALSALLGS